MLGIAQVDDRLNVLTAKQREALDLLVQHKTSKEISRALGISPHTVDQRIHSAKRILGTATRGELAQKYLQLCEARDGTAGGQSDIARPPGADGNLRAQPPAEAAPLAYRVGPALFSGPEGTIFRVVAIIAIALLFALTALAAMAIYSVVAKALA